jgi:hypothetical protein
MAYKQTPGRGNSTKTGSGISPTLMGGSPMKQKDPKKMKMSEREISIERGASRDSIEASNKAGDLYTKRERAAIGNKAANKTREINKATTTVKKTQVVGKKGPEDKYTRTPAKQMAKKMPMKQMKKKSC